jgi:hypothetical protein
MTPTHPVTSPNLGGRTGDLDGNLNRVKRELRRIRFPVDFDAGAAREGNPMALLPALHYALLGFSRHVTSSLVDAGHDLQAKSDARFVENAWRALREAFGYNPALTVSQFLSPGFAERKLMLLHDAVELCKRKHNEHARRKRAEETAAAVNREGVPRVARASEKAIEKREAEAERYADARSIDRSSLGRERATRRPAARGSLNPSRGSRSRSRSVDRAPAFAITRHEIVRREIADEQTALEGRSRPETGEDPLRSVPGSDADSDFEFSRPSLAPALASPPAREGARAPLGEVDGETVEPWFARPSRGPPTAAKGSTETAAATTDGVSLAAAKTRSGGFPDENVPPETKTLASRRSTFGDDEITGLMTQQSTSQKASSAVYDTQKETQNETQNESPETREWTKRLATRSDAVLAENLETRVAESERRAAAAVDAARAAEQVAARAVAACQETVEQFMGERARGAQLAAALAEQTAKSLLLENRVRALERAASDDAMMRSSDDARRVYSREESVSAAVSSEGRTAGSRGFVDVSGFERDANVSRSARSAIAVRRNPDPAEVSPRRDGGKPAPTETGAFIDFYSGVLGVDRAQLTLKR